MVWGSAEKMYLMSVIIRMVITGIGFHSNVNVMMAPHVITALTGRIIPQLTPAKGIFLLNALRDRLNKPTLTLTTMPAIFLIQHMDSPLATYIAETV